MIKRRVNLDEWQCDWGSAIWRNAIAGSFKVDQHILRIREEAPAA